MRKWKFKTSELEGHLNSAVHRGVLPLVYLGGTWHLAT